MPSADFVSESSGTASYPASPPIQMKSMDVPEISLDQKEASTSNDYQWQNDHLLDTIYDHDETIGNERLNSLRQFLYIEKELEIDQLAGEGSEISDESAQELIEKDILEINTKLTSYNNDISTKSKKFSDNKTLIKDLKANIKDSKKGKRSALKKDKRAKELDKLRTKAQKNISKFEKQKASAQKNLEFLEKKYGSKSDKAEYLKKKAYFESRKKSAEENIQPHQNTLLETQVEYDILAGHFDYVITHSQDQITELTEANSDLKAEIKVSKDEVKKLDKELIAINKAKKGDAKSILEWKKKRYRRELKEMGHAQLLEEVQALFDADPSMETYPEWVRYSVVHYSGLRYENAHGKHGNTKKLLGHLQEMEFSEANELDSKIMAAQGTEMLSSMENGSAGTIEEEFIGGASKAQKKNLESTSFDAVSEGMNPADKVLYSKLDELDKAQKALYLKFESTEDTAQALKINEKINSNEKIISDNESKLSPEAREKIKKAAEKRNKALISIYKSVTRKKLKALSNQQALAVLQQMHEEGQIPEEVWSEIKSSSELRVDVDSKQWEKNKKMRGLKDLDLSNPENKEVFDKWNPILKKQFYTGVTGWRKMHQESLSPNITSSLVCDQLGSQIQHLRGYERKGGLRNNALFYKDLESEGKGYFKNAPTKEDLKPGASLFFMSWSKIPKTKEYQKIEKKIQYLEAVLNGKDKELKKIEEQLGLKKKGTEEDKITGNKRNKLTKSKGKLETAISNKKAQLKALQEEAKGVTKYKNGGEQPDLSNIVTPFTMSGKSATVGNNSFTDGKVDDGGWETIIEEEEFQVTNSATRTATTIKQQMQDPQDESRTLTSYLKWQHEATVMRVTDNSVITFDTSTSFDGQKVKGLGTRKRSIDSIVGNSMVFVGYGEEKPSSGKAKKYLENVGPK